MKRQPVGLEIATARSQVVEKTVDSVLLESPVAYSLLLPKDIDGGGRFPVLYLLHGRGDDHRTWNENTSVASAVAELPLIVVMPDAKQSRYLNSVGGGRWQDFFLDELVPHIDATLPTIAQQHGRAIAGLSMGGYGALRLALTAADRFAAAAAMSGSVDWGETRPEDFPVYLDLLRDLYGGDGDAERRQYAADALWPRVEPHITSDGWAGPALYLACGWADRHFDHNRALRERLSVARVPHTWSEGPGGHTWDYWELQIRHALCFLMLHLQSQV